MKGITKATERMETKEEIRNINQSPKLSENNPPRYGPAAIPEEKARPYRPANRLPLFVPPKPELIDMPEIVNREYAIPRRPWTKTYM